MQIGTINLGNNKYKFNLWSPLANKVDLVIYSPDKRVIKLNKYQNTYWSADVDNLQAGTLYKYRLNGRKEYPDPASHWQPQGVHSYSQVIDHNSFKWSEADKQWQGIEKNKLIIYELHVGTFTPEGTFKAIISRLDDLADLGINTIELMPIGAFPGERNWGYDETYKYAPNNSYGHPDDLKNLVDECHKRNIAICLDVVYNHFGPEGNYSGMFAPYLTDKYQSPWGQAINFDGKYGDDVGNYFIENALFWFKNYHIDMLRLDSIHNIYDTSNIHILRQIAEATEEFAKSQNKNIFLIAESDLNDSRVLKSKEMGGHALDGQWSDDFHHSLHTLLTGEPNDYYMGYSDTEHFKKVMEEGYAYSPLTFHHFKKHDNSPEGVLANCFVVFSQNHDQIGNRVLGERLSQLISFDALKLAAATYLLSPYIPMIFMGEEYAEKNPFFYFISHSDSGLIQSVRKGRKREFHFSDSGIEPPDPQDKQTFFRSKLDWQSRNKDNHQIILKWYKTLIILRKTVTALSYLDKKSMLVYSNEPQKYFIIQRWHELTDSHVLLIMNFNDSPITINTEELPEETRFIKLIDSSEKQWGGPGSVLPEQLMVNNQIVMNAHSFALYSKEIF